MSKAKRSYVCEECGVDHARWQGQCGSCGAWNSLREFRPAARSSGREERSGIAGEAARVLTLDFLEERLPDRFPTGIGELDRVLGGGVMPGSVVLLGGEPGAGKSTLLLQLCAGLSRDHEVLYITGEESLEQVAMRARRLGIEAPRLRLGSETCVESILDIARESPPQLLVVDSIQTAHSEALDNAPGTLAQVRESAAHLIQFAKKAGTAVFLIGHVTKDGSLAGPKALEHMIDCSIMMEAGDDFRFRCLRSLKNRFGPVGELGIFAMMEDGLKEVSNPSAIFLRHSQEPAPGSVVTVLWEGSRPILAEIQALVDICQGGYPRRLAVGLDQNRLVLQLAALHKHGGVAITDQDVFLSLVGGLRTFETAPDLAMSLAALSSFRCKRLPGDLAVFGEVGLSGEIRPVHHGQERLQEAYRHGFRRALIPEGNKPKGEMRKRIPEMSIQPVEQLSEALDFLSQEASSPHRRR